MPVESITWYALQQDLVGNWSVRLFQGDIMKTLDHWKAETPTEVEGKLETATLVGWTFEKTKQATLTGHV